MEFLKRIQTHWNLKSSKNKILLGAFLGLGLLALLISGNENKESVAVPAPRESPQSVDTFIPRGYVLVPVELANANSLSSILGEMGGVVDLYLAQGQKSSLKVASRLKILRAPLNPDMYAVMVREQESSKILSFAGPFIAVVQNPTAEGQKVSDSRHTKISIDYQN